MKVRDHIIAISIKKRGRWDEIYQAIVNSEFLSKEEAESLISQINCKTLTILDADYPSYLREYYKPPFVLFYYGDISLIKEYKDNIAVVGSREPEANAIKNTDRIVSELAKKYTIVSGLARGIDRQAHESAIKSGGKTIAVLGSGIDLCYPSSNEELYEEIKRNHLLISEYFGNQVPNPENFPHRNRLIVMFSRSTFIPCAKRKSGTSISANYTQLFNHTIFCLPSANLDDSLCNDLIHDGAVLVRNSDDIIYEMDGIFSYYVR